MHIETVRHDAATAVDPQRLMIETGIELANLDQWETDTCRSVLAQHQVLRSHAAGTEELDDLIHRFASTRDILRSLPDTGFDDAVEAVNTQLAALSVAPMLSVHDGSPLHMHWTASDAPLGEQVVVDVLMALAHSLTIEGLERFGRCAANDCQRLYYDGSRNRSRRFCSDPRCASRTRTADHRARKRSAI